jgi:hypothetical protein
MPGALATVEPWSPRESSQRQQVTPPLPGRTSAAPSPCHASSSFTVLPPIMAEPCTTKMKRGSGGSWNSTFSADDRMSS